MAYNGRWRPYVPVARRRAQGEKKMAALRKKGIDVQPVRTEGRKIARTFWGEAWCDHLESFSDFDNRLPRGRTYVRNGSVCHLGIEKGKVEAKVSGSEIYEIKVNIKTLSVRKWNAIKKRCSGQIGSLLELLKGDLSDNIMQVVTDRKDGLFPKPAEISFTCDCPDWAGMCKHVAAVLYGIGTRLDQDPALLFRLRGVNHEELIDVDTEVAVPAGTGRGGSKRLAADELGDVFGIDLEPDAAPTTSRPSKSAGKGTSGTKKSAPRKNKSSATRSTASSAKSRSTKTQKKNTNKKASSTRKKSKPPKRSPAKAVKKAAKSNGRASNTRTRTKKSAKKPQSNQQAAAKK